MLTAKQIIGKGIINNWKEDGVAQVGIDLHLKSISLVTGCGEIPAEGKTKLASTTSIKFDKEGWVTLNPHSCYEVTFEEGCNFGANEAGRIVNRSSLYRNGVILQSPMFDPGFNTENIGSFIYTTCSIKLQKGSRLGQMIVFTTDEEAELYDGQYQNDKQRNA